MSVSYSAPVLTPFRLAPLFLALASAAALADDDSLQLAPLVVTGVAQQSPLTVVTDPKLPRQPMPASDAADYLKSIPGFSAIRNGGSNGDPVLRGMFGSRLNLLVDGGQMIGACPYRMDAPSSYISPESYDRLTVIKGPQTVLWGPGASAGTVLFERDPESFEQFGTRLNGSVLVGSHGRIDKRIDGALGNAEGYLRFSGNHAMSDDYEDGGGHEVPSRWKKWNGDLVAGWTPDEDTLIELSAGKGDGEARYAGRGMDGAQFQRESLALRVERRNLSEVLEKLEARVYYNYADHVMDNYSLRTPSGTGMMAGPMASNVDRRTLGARLASTWRWSDFQLITGVDAQRSDHRERNSSTGMLGEFISAGSQPWSQDARFHNYGALGEMTWYASERQRVIGGLRLDRASAKDYRQSIGSGMSSTANPTAGDTRSKTLPGGFLRYERDLQSLPATAYVGVGHTERFPDYWELFSPNNGPLGELNAFDGIEPEKTTQLDVGLQYQQGPLQAWVSAYAGVIDDYILFDYSRSMMGMSSSRARNIDARIAGGEMGGSWQIDPHWKAEASLAYAWGENRDDGRALPQMPPLDGRLGLTYAHGAWSVGGLWRVVASQGRVAEGQGNVVGRDFDESAGFGVLSLNSAWQVSRQFKLSAGVDNLFDKDYAEHLNLAGDAGFGFAADTRIHEPGRTLWTRVDFSF